MILLLFFIGSSNNFGIGIGNYPSGLLSMKFHYTPETVLQFTLGTGSNTLAIGGRALFGIGKGSGKVVQYTHLVGVGAGIHSHTYKDTEKSNIKIVGEGFYEFEFFPNLEEVPLSLEIGIGLVIDTGGMDLFVPFGIHFYLK